MKRSFTFTLGRVVGIAGGAWGVIATIAVFTLPMYQTVETTATSSGEFSTRAFSQTFLQVQGHLESITIFFFAAMIGFSLAALAVSVLAHINPRLARVGALTAGIVLLFGSFISGFSVGGFYLPGALLVLLAGVLMLAG